MGPPQAQIRYNIHTTVTKVFQLGEMWFIHFDGSWESLAVGFEEPDLLAGDKVLITFQRIADKGA